MPRLPRLHVPGGCYHVILRGNHREAIFGSDQDRIELNKFVAEALTRYQHVACILLDDQSPAVWMPDFLDG